MPNKERGGGGAQNQGEKKDHSHRGDGRSGHDRDNQFDAPQAMQASGRRTPQATPGRSSEPSHAGEPGQPNPPTDNTRPHGNRPKRMNQGRLDHN